MELKDVLDILLKMKIIEQELVVLSDELHQLVKRLESVYWGMIEK